MWTEEEIRKELNERQYEAVTAPDGPLLVIAGAGSGKTRVIEFRVRYLVEKGINPASILLLTFTRRSAREMISRAAHHDPRCSGVDGGTFHSFANKMVRKFSGYFGLSEGFTIYDESDAEEAVHRCAVSLGFYSREKRMPRKDMLRKILSMAVNKELSIEEVLADHYPEFLPFADDIRDLRVGYTEYKVANQTLDYDDLLLYLRLLLDNEMVRNQLTARYRAVMVDEFQDTNGVQGEIACLLARERRNILVVGDDAQSIYGFRGSTHRNIMEFPQKFPGCRVITLEDNYRSTQAILDVGNAVLDNMKNKYRKCLKAVKTDEGVKPHLVYFRDAHEEAEWIAGKIKESCDGGMELSHQCILFRSAYITIPLQAELSRRNIPFALYGGLRFYETAHVKDLVAHLKVIANPKDQLSWNRVLLLIDGIGPKTAERLTGEVCGSHDLTATAELLRSRGTGKSYSAGLSALADVFRTAGLDGEPAARFRVAMDYYLPLMREKYDIDWHLRKNDLDALEQIAGRYGNLDELLTDLSIEPPERGVKDFHDTVWERPLILSTIHSAKGLEWRHVYLMGAIDGVLPSSYCTRNEEELEEEQRLLYVAVTRARERLFLLVHHEGRNNGIHTFNRLSRFVDMPNVRACLEEKYLFPSPQEGGSEIEPVKGLEKAELLSKLLGSMK